ncbi:MAG TPA: glycosyltransferase family 4 protein [Methylomirabilota bacterium]|nr:glycosyltransferase family 4 protein [Methylomirabilota bacterium]HEV8613923.1 glycosyltransferase family 4 protein [Methylomirabilota bacterium]
MKILLIARPFVFHGGVERATAGLLGALARHGHAVHVLSPGAQAPVPGVVTRRLLLPRLPTAGRALALAIVTRLVVRRGSWDVVQSHERTLCQHVYRAGEGCHRAYLEAMGARYNRGLRHRVLLALERRVFETTPRVVAIAAAGRREIQKLYGVDDARMSVVYNGIDLERFHPRNRALHRLSVLAEAGVPQAAWVALFVGSGFERKGLATALRGFAAFGDRDSRLLVLGRGQTGAYEKLAEDLGIAARVTWLGARRDVERWYAGADVLLLPARYEPFGNVHLEALASGVPVVTSRRAGGAEVVTPECGAVVDPRDAPGVRTALEVFRVCDRAGTAGAARAAAEPFTFEQQVAGFERIYRGLSGATGDYP